MFGDKWKQVSIDKIIQYKIITLKDMFLQQKPVEIIMPESTCC